MVRYAARTWYAHLAILTIFLSILPLGTAGTEADPELTDPTDDVQYSAAHIGARDRTHVDIVSAFFSYDNASRQLTLYFTATDYTGLIDRLQGWSMSCALQVDVGGPARHLDLQWHKFLDTNEFTTSGFVRGAGGTAAKQVDAKFTIKEEKPGHVIVTMPVDALLEFGATLSSPRSLCAESQTSISAAASRFNNSDQASGNKTFKIPLQTENEGGNVNGTSAATRTSSPTSTRSPTASVPIVLLSLLGLIVLTRKR